MGFPSSAPCGRRSEEQWEKLYHTIQYMFSLYKVEPSCPSPSFTSPGEEQNSGGDSDESLTWTLRTQTDYHRRQEIGMGLGGEVIFRSPTFLSQQDSSMSIVSNTRQKEKESPKRKKTRTEINNSTHELRDDEDLFARYKQVPLYLYTSTIGTQR